MNAKEDSQVKGTGPTARQAVLQHLVAEKGGLEGH